VKLRVNVSDGKKILGEAQLEIPEAPTLPSGQGRWEWHGVLHPVDITITPEWVLSVRPIRADSVADRGRRRPVAAVPSMRAADPPKGKPFCVKCGRTFANMLGLGIHKAKAHGIPSPARDPPKKVTASPTSKASSQSVEIRASRVSTDVLMKLRNKLEQGFSYDQIFGANPQLNRLAIEPILRNLATIATGTEWLRASEQLRLEFVERAMGVKPKPA
jgi:hypothetical protein